MSGLCCLRWARMASRVSALYSGCLCSCKQPQAPICSALAGGRLNLVQLSKRSGSQSKAPDVAGLAPGTPQQSKADGAPVEDGLDPDTPVMDLPVPPTGVP